MAAKRPISTIREQVYQILRDDICQGVYAPGTRLQEVDLAENLNVSRSPVREALRQLAADGLLLEIPNKGVYVKEFTAKDLGVSSVAVDSRMTGGIILESEDGTIQIDMQYKTLLQTLWDREMKSLSDILFG